MWLLSFALGFVTAAAVLALVLVISPAFSIRIWTALCDLEEWRIRRERRRAGREVAELLARRVKQKRGA